MEVVLLRPATVASKVMASKVEMAIQEVMAVVIDQILIIWHVNFPTSISTTAESGSTSFLPIFLRTSISYHAFHARLSRPHPHPTCTCRVFLLPLIF